jgi:hypothetical protein
MSDIRKKRIFFFVLTAAVWCAASASALPGFSPYIDDVSGEYVYYRDYTFSRTVYVGFLYYNDSAYAVRYYAPEDAGAKLPARSLEIFFSLDPRADHVELTGERIVGSVTPDDTDTINYMHDIFYELNSRRIKAGAVLPAGAVTGKTVKDDFPQFGGAVTVEYDCLVPLFNVKKITSADGSVLFQVVTGGALHSSEDTAFTVFTGVPDKYVDRTHVFSRDNGAKPKKVVTTDGQTITLDSQWVQAMDNLWLLGDTAIVSAAVIPVPGGAASDKADYVVLRRMLQSTKDSYVNWSDISLAFGKKQYIINSVFVQPESNTVTRTFRILTKKYGGGYYFFTLSVFNNIYQTNRSYFDGIIGGYAVLQ